MRYKRFYDPSVKEIAVIVRVHKCIETRSALYTEGGFYFVIANASPLCEEGDLVTLVQRPDRCWDVKR